MELSRIESCGKAQINSWNLQSSRPGSSKPRLALTRGLNLTHLARWINSLIDRFTTDSSYKIHKNP